MFEEERERLVGDLMKWGYLTKPELIAAFKKVPREGFLQEKSQDLAYSDQPLYIGNGQTISAPSMIAIMMQTLDLKRGQSVLEIGAGSGYNAALLAEAVGESGKVVTMERISELAAFARANLRKTGYGRVKVVVGDGTLGYDEGAPWDRILVTACAPNLSLPLLAQLAPGGKLGAPVGEHYMFQTWKVATKIKGEEIKVADHGGCSFVPLIGAYGWKE